jgi:hypothetical protein
MANEGLLPANIPLLQPGSRYFRLVDALQSLDISANVNQQIVNLQNQINTNNGHIATLQSQVATLQSQVTALQNQLNGITFANVVEAVPPAALTGRFGVTIQGVAMSIGLYAP